MMKECTQRAFAMLSHEKQTDFRNRYGQWYESRGQFLQALAAYNKALNYDAALAVIRILRNPPGFSFAGKGSSIS